MKKDKPLSGIQHTLLYLLGIMIVIVIYISIMMIEHLPGVIDEMYKVMTTQSFKNLVIAIIIAIVPYILGRGFYECFMKDDL